jgi:hypothetical protein
MNSIAFFAYTRHTPDPLHAELANRMVAHSFELLIPDAIDYSSVLRLEEMMRLSHCFVAIESSTDKDDGNSDTSALLFQYDLARRANKPTLVLIDYRLKRQPLVRLGRDNVVVFNGTLGLERTMHEIERDIASLQYRTLPRPESPCSSDVCVLIDSAKDIHAVYSDSVVSTIRRLLKAEGYVASVIPLTSTLDDGFYDSITNCAFVVIDGRSSLFSPQIAEGIAARFVPIVRLCHIKDGESTETVSARELSAAVAGYELEVNGRKIRPVICWRNEAQLEAALSEMLRVSNLPRSPLLSNRADVNAHFRRSDSVLQFRVTKIPPAPPKVFLSNSSTTAKSLVNAIARRLRAETIEFFHYENEDDIPLGDNWQRTLDTQVRQCAIFVALINQDYFASEWCVYEMRLAIDLLGQDRIKLFPYFLDKDWGMSDSDCATKLGCIEHKIFLSTSHDEIADHIVRNYKRSTEIHY